MIILGLNAYHGDSAACLVRDGEIIAAAEEERFRRIKHWAGFPSDSIEFCLREAGASLANVDIVAVNSDPSANFLRKAAFALRQRPNIRFIADRLRNQAKRQSIDLNSPPPFLGRPLKARSSGSSIILRILPPPS
jgi:carbamoyltransferase